MSYIFYHNDSACQELILRNLANFSKLLLFFLHLTWLSMRIDEIANPMLFLAAAVIWIYSALRSILASERQPILG